MQEMRFSLKIGKKLESKWSQNRILVLFCFVCLFFTFVIIRNGNIKNTNSVITNDCGAVSGNSRYTTCLNWETKTSFSCGRKGIDLAFDKGRVPINIQRLLNCPHQ